MLELPASLGVIAGRTSAKALGLGALFVKNRVDDRRMTALVAAGASHPERRNVLGRLTLEDAEAIQPYLESPEIEAMALAIAQYHMLKVCGRASEDGVKALRMQMRQSLRLVAGLDAVTAERMAAALYDLVEQAVMVELDGVVAGKVSMPPTTRAALVKTASSQAAVTVRNAELLASIADLAAVREFENHFAHQVRSLHATMRLPHAGTSRQVPYERLYVQPSVALQVSPGADSPACSVPDAVAHSVRLVLLGDPGGGKSTLSLKLTFDIASRKVPGVPATVPFLVVLREYAERYRTMRTSIPEFLELLCGSPYSVKAPEGAIEYLLMNGRAAVIFDGLDELLDTSLRREMAQAVEGFAHRYPMTQILVTSRRVGYDEASLDDELFPVMHLQQFGREQVEAYARKWFSLDDSVASGLKNRMASDFLSNSEFVSDLRVNPLLLSLMCGIYSSEHYIPRNRPEVYEKCALLLFDRWDRQRGIAAPLSFDAHVQAAMRSLALWLYPRQQAQQGMARADLITFMAAYLLKKRFDNEEDAEQAATEFIDFCKGRAWVLTDVGADLYGFTHRTFLEYFAASQLVRTNASAAALLEELWPRIIKAEWDVVAQLAVQILGKAVEDGADDFLQELLDRGESNQSSAEEAALARSFACRTLQFIVPRPDVLRRIVEAAIEALAGHREPGSASGASGDSRQISEILKATPENLELLGRYLRDALKLRFSGQIAHGSPVLLEVLLHPLAFGGERGSGNADFWLSWATENHGIFQQALMTDWERAPWLAGEMVLRGELRYVEFVRRFGVEESFRPHPVGRRSLLLPPALSVLSAALNAGKSQALSVTLVADVIEALLNAKRPWIAAVREARASREPDGRGLWEEAVSDMFGFGLFDFGFISSRTASTDAERFMQLDPAVRSAVSLILLPFLEEFSGGRIPLVHSPDKWSRGRRDLLGFLSGWGTTSGRERPPSLASLQLLPVVEEFVARWLSHEVSVTSSGGVRRSKAHR